ncbi:MAG: carboxypeptidase-like regulatory domain-containing protein [Gemmatimonadales bacterium]
MRVPLVPSARVRKNRPSWRSTRPCRSAAFAAGLLVGSAQFLAAQEFGSVTGIVRDTAGAPVAGAEVLLADQRIVTTAQGAFRFDSLRVGNYLITIRLVGYAALRSGVLLS